MRDHAIQVLIWHTRYSSTSLWYDLPHVSPASRRNRQLQHMGWGGDQEKKKRARRPIFASRYFVQICRCQETYRLISHAANVCRMDDLERKQGEASRWRPEGH